MNLSSKIFLGFFILLTSLTGLTLYLTHQQTEKFEIARISDKLRDVQMQFQEKISSHQQATLKLVKTITLDQKFRSFLAQIKDNFYSFTEEIALDTGADIVFMVDEEKKMRGIYPSSGADHDWVKKNLDSFSLDGSLDQGMESVHISPIGNELFSVICVPLKESFSDDYALGVMVVGNKMDDDWLRWLIGGKATASQFRAIFFTGVKQVAGNAEPKLAKAVMENMGNIAEGTGTFLFSGERYITRRGWFENGENVSGFVYLSNLDQSLKPFEALQETLLLAGLGILLIGLVFSVMFSKRVVRSLHLLLSGTKKVIEGDYDFQIQHKSSDECGKLADAFNHMVRELKEKKFIQETFGKYVHPSIVEHILSDPEKLKLGGERRVQTVMFTDIEGFTTFSERMSADTLISFLNQYLGAMAEEVMLQEGILNQYNGDGIIALWGPPFTEGNHSRLACMAAIKIQQRVKSLTAQLSQEGFPHIKVRIGLATGNMIVGNIGSEVAQTYTCMGDTVNFGSRLEGLNKYYGTEIIIDFSVYTGMGESLAVRELDTIQVKGRQQGSTIYELLALKDAVRPEQIQLKNSYEEALKCYRSAEFHPASEKFLEVAEEYSDKASRVMHARCLHHIEHPPRNWTGIYAMSEK